MDLIKCDKNGVGLKLNEIYNIDALEGLKMIESESINDGGIFGSPPYADLRKYGKNKVGSVKAENYVEWFLPFAKEVYRIMGKNSMFGININTKVENNQESLYVFKLVIALVEKIGFKLHSVQVWIKQSNGNQGGPKRARDMFEYIILLYKNDHIFNVDDIRKEYTDATIKRYGYQFGKNKYNQNAEDKFVQPNLYGALPTNVHYFKSARKRGNIHVAPFDEQMSDWFVKAFTKEGATVIDFFMGSGTTGVSAKGLNRNYIGFDLVSEYVDLARERIEKTPRGKKLEEHKKEMEKRKEKTKKDIEKVRARQKERLEKKKAKEEAEKEVS